MTVDDDLHHSAHSHYDTRYVRGGQVFRLKLCVEPGVLAAIDQGLAAIHGVADERYAEGDYLGALITLPDHERLAALHNWLQQGVPREKLLGDPNIQVVLADLVPHDR
jgi:hypothetical protein